MYCPSVNRQDPDATYLNHNPAASVSNYLPLITQFSFTTPGVHGPAHNPCIMYGMGGWMGGSVVQHYTRPFRSRSQALENRLITVMVMYFLVSLYALDYCTCM